MDIRYGCNSTTDMDKPAREALKARIDREMFGGTWQELCLLLAYVDDLEDKLRVTDELFEAACDDIADLQAERDARIARNEES